DLGHPECGRGLELEDRQARAVQQSQRGCDVLELDGLVADVEDDPEVPADQAYDLARRQTGQPGQAVGPGAGPDVLLEVPGRFLGRLEEAVRLRLQGQVHPLPGPPLEL